MCRRFCGMEACVKNPLGTCRLARTHNISFGESWGADRRTWGPTLIFSRLADRSVKPINGQLRSIEFMFANVSFPGEQH